MKENLQVFYPRATRRALFDTIASAWAGDSGTAEVEYNSSELQEQKRRLDAQSVGKFAKFNYGIAETADDLVITTVRDL